MKISQLIEEFEKYGITPELVLGRIVLYGGFDAAREHYAKLLRENENIEIKLIFELTKFREDVFCQIDERAAIRAADNLPGDFWSAIKCAFKPYQNEFKANQKNQAEPKNSFWGSLQTR